MIGQSATSRFAENNPLDAIDWGALVSLALASRGRGVLRSSVRPGRRYDQAARGVKPVVLVLGERA